MTIIIAKESLPVILAGTFCLGNVYGNESSGYCCNVFF